MSQGIVALARRSVSGLRLGCVPSCAACSAPLSLAFRLFGSVFAGHVLVSTILAIAPVFLFPILILELFMGFIQAVIFAVLALVFLSIATAHEAPGPEQSEAARGGTVESIVTNLHLDLTAFI